MVARRALPALAALLVVALLAGACSRGDDDGPEADATDDGNDPVTTTTVLEAEEVDADDIDGFWALPDPIPASDPGRLVRFQDAGEVGGAPATRIMYTPRPSPGSRRS